MTFAIRATLLSTGVSEEIDEFETEEEAFRALEEYKLAFGSDWSGWCVYRYW